MKQILIYLLISLPFFSKAQKKIFPFNDEGKIVYTVVDSSTLSKQQMFTNATAWLAKTFVNSKNATSDATAGKIIYKMKQGLANNNEVQYTAELDFKDNKYRLRLFDFVHVSNYKALPSVSFGLEELYKGQLTRKDKNAAKGIANMENVNKEILDQLYALKKAIEFKDDF